MKNHLLTIIMAMVSVAACTDSHISDKERAKVKEEMQSRKLKKLADVDILEFAKIRASALADTAQKLLGGTLMKTIQQDGIVEAISYCNVVAYPLIDSIATAQGLYIKRVSLRTRNPQDVPDAYETSLLEAYEYALEKGVQPTEEIRFSDDKKQVLYSRPIMISNAMCLNCHGTIGAEILPQVHDKINALYPADNATGHKLGDLRGMWSIKMSVQDVVRKM